MPITSLRFTNVGPFDDITFEFDEHVNVFTGPNNSGKSTALSVLGDLVVYPFGLPLKLLRGESASYDIGLRTGNETSRISGTLPVRRYYELDLSTQPSEQLSLMEHQDEQQWKQHVELLTSIGYSVFIPALRRSTDFRAEGPIARKREEIDTGKTNTIRVRLTPGRGHTISPGLLRQLTTVSSEVLVEWHPELKKRLNLISTNPSLVSDEAVIQKIIELDYTAYRRQQPSIRGIIDRIATVVSEITEGFPIQFIGVDEDEEGLFPKFRTPDGDIPLNVLSQGTQSIIQWLAHLLIGYAEYYDYPENLEEKPGILIIDEIDAHLHPSWQRRIIPTLTKYFPNLQIFCSTHSPLMLAGLKEGQVQLLKRDDKGKVTVTRNETDIKGWSADEIYRSFLDVRDPTDLATIADIKRLQELSIAESLSPKEAKELEQLRRTVSQDLLGGPMAGEIEHLTSLLKQIKAENAALSRAKPKPDKRRRKPASTSQRVADK